MSWFLINRNLTPLEPYDWKLSSTVLRGERGSNAPDLPGNDQIGDFKYGVNVNFSDFLSKIDYMNDGEQISGGKIKRAGVLFNEFYGYVCEGIYQTQEEVNNSARTSTTVTVGDLKYRDISGPDGVPDGVISPEYDRVPLGNSLPRFPVWW